MATTSPWVERVARFGILSKATVYLTIGGLATAVALDVGGVLTGSRGVLQLIVRQPLGRGVIALLAVGLAAYMLWLLVQAFVDPDGNGTSLFGLVNRAGQAITGLAHGLLVYEGVILAAGYSGSDGRGLEQLVGRLLIQPFGVWVVGAAGVVIVVIAGSQIWRGVMGDVRRNWRLEALDPERDRWPILIGRFGLAARGVVLGVAGVLVIRAARGFDPSEVGGVADVLRTLRAEQPSEWLLALVAIGLVAYGFFALIEARYRFIPSA